VAISTTTQAATKTQTKGSAMLTAESLFPAKLEKQTKQEEREFRQRFEAIPGYDPVAKQIDDSSIGEMMRNPWKIDKLARPPVYASCSLAILLFYGFHFFFFLLIMMHVISFVMF
jgi:hypothetical protein